MAISINGNGTITGLAVGGLPDGCVDTGTLASNAISAATLPAGTIVQTVLNSGTASSSSVQLNSGAMDNPSFFDTGLRTVINPIFANSKILVNFMFSLRISDGNRLGVMAYVSMSSNMSNLARISEFRGTTGNESYRNAAGGVIWSSLSLFAVDDGSYSGSGGQLSMSTASRHYNIGYYNASGDGTNYYGDHSQRVFLMLQEIKQ